MNLTWWGWNQPLLSNQASEKEPAEIIITPPLTVETDDTHVYFYSEVNSDRALDLIQRLRETDARLRWMHSNRELPGENIVPIWLHINSSGGDLFTAFAVADQVAGLKTPVYSIIEGLAASAATIISVACTKRFILPHSYMLIHQFWSAFWGKHEEFKDEMALQEMLIDQFVEFYQKRTKLSSEDLREKLKHDFWMNAQQALQYGFVDEIRPSASVGV